MKVIVIILLASLSAGNTAVNLPGEDNLNHFDKTGIRLLLRACIHVDCGDAHYQHKYNR